MIRGNLWRWLLGMTILSLATWAGGQDLERLARAYDLESDEYLFTLREIRRYAGDRLQAFLTEYRHQDGEVFATKTLVYRRHPAMPDMQLHDRRTGHREWAQLTATHCHSLFQRHATAKAKTAELPLPPLGVIDAGLEFMIAEHWPALLAGETVYPAFLVPAQQGFIDFRMQLIAPGTDDRPWLAIEAKNPLLRLIAPRIALRFDAKTGNLIDFRGPLNLRDRQGHPYQVRLDFSAWQPYLAHGES